MEELDKEVKKLREDLQTLQKEKEKSDSGKVCSATHSYMYYIHKSLRNITCIVKSDLQIQSNLVILN